ncbi:MAG TPA: TonB-dependent receptor, partial [Terracidiphilus sp.]|nr:TonB-dependent receptor [Terracidiphilus sp.]
MLRRLLVLCLALMAGIAVASAASTVSVTGKVTDSSGATIQGAAVTLTDLGTNSVTHTTTAADGTFVFHGVSTGPQVLSIEKSGFESYTVHISPATEKNITATLTVAALNDSVIVRGTVDPEATPMPTREEVMMMPETVRVLDRKQLDAAGPVAGGAQMLSSTPGTNVVGYGETGATKYTVIMNGLQQGWAGEATSFIGVGSLGVTYDGIPVADPATGLWQSATMPQSLMIQDVQTNYGPGPAAERGYFDVGGRVEFTPIQPTEETHLSAAVTDGPYGQQNFAFVGNSGAFKGWSTVAGGGMGRGDDFRVAPDGFGNPTKNGSVYGKTIKDFSAGSIAMGVLYAKGGGYRPQVIPSTDVGLVEPVSGIHYSQATSGFYSTLPFADYNKYDTNEMFMTYGRERMNPSRASTLENSTWYTHIRRFHRRNEDAVSTGDQVDEWNNPHSNMFGDQIAFSQVFPYNTVSVGGYLIHEVYNAHNLFYNPLNGGNGAEQIVGTGSKFRSGYFQQDDVSFFAQDDFHPIARIHIIPSLRVVGFDTSYSDQAAHDFSFAPSTYFSQATPTSPIVATSGPVYLTHCSMYPQTGSNATDPYYNVFGNPVPTTDGGDVAKDQGSLCGAHEGRSGVEPGIDASVTPKDWITIYGGYDTTYRSPELGGGGGQFQAVNPAYYQLAKGAYAQIGAKVHFMHAPGLGNFIAGVDYFHNNYTNQEIDYETATGDEFSDGGNSVYHGVDAFFDADPKSNIHFFFNFAGEASNFTSFVTGGPLAGCGTPSSPAAGCTFYNNLPVSYVPKVTLNTGIYYGIRHNNHTFLEPRFWIESTGSQYLWSNLSGGPSNTTMPSYTTVNLALNAPIRVGEKQSFNLRVDMMNLANSEYNEYEYISSGAYFAELWPGSTPPPSGYLNVYPGAPRAVYGTIT